MFYGAKIEGAAPAAVSHLLRWRCGSSVMIDVMPGRRYPFSCLNRTIDLTTGVL